MSGRKVTDKKKSSGFLLQFGIAAALVGGLVGALSLARLTPNQDGVGGPVTDSPVAAASVVAPPSERPPSRWLIEARELLPPDAWLVADVAGKLVWSQPFAVGPGERPLGAYCESMPAPDRVAIAVTRPKSAAPGSGGSGGSAGLTPPSNGRAQAQEELPAEFDLVLAAPRVTDDFFDCVLAKVAEHGGKPPERAEGYTVVESRSGLIIHSPEGHLWFSSNLGDLERGLSLLRGRAPSAASSGTHGEYTKRLRGTRSPNETIGLVTFDLPASTLTNLSGDLPDDLDHLRRGGLVGFVDGGALGTVECPPEVCARLAGSLEVLSKYAAKELPIEIRARAERALRIETVPGDAFGRIIMIWTPNEIRITELIEYVSARMTGAGPRPGAAPQVP